MIVHECPLNGILLFEPKIHEDFRGIFLESFEKKRYEDYGIKELFLQDNFSRSSKNVLRGLHYNNKAIQSQLLTVLNGIIFDVVVDIRRSSSTYGKWFGIKLGEGCPKQIYMPHGFAHGFCVLSKSADLHYKVSAKYARNNEGGIIWNDPDLNIKWPITSPILSYKDRKNLKLREVEI